jgi:hypothetical protein
MSSQTIYRPGRRRRLALHLGLALAASAVLSLGAVTAAGAATHVARPAGGAGASTKGPIVGTYLYSDNEGDTNEDLTLSSGNTVSFESGCTGTWVSSGKTIAIDLDSTTCFDRNWLLTGTIKGKKMTGIGEVSNPGSPPTISEAITWTAVTT